MSRRKIALPTTTLPRKTNVARLVIWKLPQNGAGRFTINRGTTRFSCELTPSNRKRFAEHVTSLKPIRQPRLPNPHEDLALDVSRAMPLPGKLSRQMGPWPMRLDMLRVPTRSFEPQRHVMAAINSTFPNRKKHQCKELATNIGFRVLPRRVVRRVICPW